MLVCRVCSHAVPVRVRAVCACAAVAVSAEEPADDDVDRTDFTEEHLKEDKPKNSNVALEPHSEVEAAALLPDVPDDSRTTPKGAPARH